MKNVCAVLYILWIVIPEIKSLRSEEMRSNMQMSNLTKIYTVLQEHLSTLAKIFKKGKSKI